MARSEKRRTARTWVAFLPLLFLLGVVLFGAPVQPGTRRAKAEPPGSPAQSRQTEVEPLPADGRSLPKPHPIGPVAPGTEPPGWDLSRQSAQEADAKSAGCVQCHQKQHDPHGKPETVRLGCVDCHGGN